MVKSLLNSLLLMPNNRALGSIFQLMGWQSKYKTILVCTVPYSITTMRTIIMLAFPFFGSKWLIFFHFENNNLLFLSIIYLYSYVSWTWTSVKLYNTLKVINHINKSCTFLLILCWYRVFKISFDELLQS